MKIRKFALLHVITLLDAASSLKLASTDSVKDPNDAFRSDSTLRFMRHLGKQNPKEMKKSMEDGFKDLQRGPEYESKEAQEASEKRKVKEQAPSALDPVQGAQDIIEDIGDAIADAGRGPNYKSKRARKAVSDQQAKKARKAREDGKPERSGVPGCTNSPRGWADAKGRDCQDYAEGEFCTRRGGYGDAWLDEWDTFADQATDGRAANEVCCVCGGGVRGGSPGPAPAGPFPAPAPAPARMDPSDAPAPAPAAAGGAPAPAGGGAPAPGPASSPAIAGPILGTKAGRPLQEQGYSGDLVMHEDTVTMTDDWGREFGPHTYDANHVNVKKICLEHPGNEWCSLHGYYDKESAASSVSALIAMVSLLARYIL